MKGWEIKKLGDIADISAGNSAPQADRLFVNGKYPFFRTADAGRVRFGDISKAADYLNDEGIKGLRQFPKGTILFPKSGASTFLNHRVMLAVEGYVSSHLATIVADRAKAHPRYLLYYLTTVAAQDLIQDHAYPSLNLPLIAGIDVSLPSLSEQQRIVGILDEAFEGIATAKANAEKNLQNAHALFKGHLQSVFNQNGKGWEKGLLGEVCELFQGLCINSKSKHLLVEKSSLPLLRIKDLRENTAEQYVAESGWPPKARVTEEDIIYTRTGQIGLVFRGRNGVLHNNCFKVKPKPIIESTYLFWWLQSPAFRSRIIALASKAAQPDITHAIFKAQPILIPPRAYQDQTVSIIEEMNNDIQHLETVYRKKVKNLEALRTALLHQAFSGQL